MTKEEIWLPIEGFEGYEVSSKGRLKSLGSVKYSGRKHTTKRTYPEKILKTRFTSRGYELGTACKNGKLYHFSVHRLVAKAFLENPKNLPDVNHINNDKTDNSYSNLEWCSKSYNSYHAFLNNRQPGAFERGKKELGLKKTINIETGETFDSAILAFEQSGLKIHITTFYKKTKSDKTFKYKYL